MHVHLERVCKRTQYTVPAAVKLHCPGVGPGCRVVVVSLPWQLSGYTLLYTFGDNNTHCKTKSVYFWGAYELSN